MVRHFIRFNDLDLEEHLLILKRALVFKQTRFKKFNNHFKGRTLGMIFNKKSTRTRISFEVGISELGGHTIFMTEDQTQISRGEPLEHTAKVMSRYLAALIIRNNDETILSTLAAHGSIPIINALTDQGHPCQVLSDLLTISEHYGLSKWQDLKICWVGDGNNMANSWIEAAGIFGFTLCLACPETHQPDDKILHLNQVKNPNIVLTQDVEQAAKNSHVINTDVWTSMGQEEETGDRQNVFSAYQVNEKLMAIADPEALFLHCLPAHIGEEVSIEVINSPSSVVFDQAENRLHAQKALLEFLIPSLY